MWYSHQDSAAVDVSGDAAVWGPVALAAAESDHDEPVENDAGAGAEDCVGP